MTIVQIRLFHRSPGGGAGPIEGLVDQHRRRLADLQLEAFRQAGAADAAVVTDAPETRGRAADRQAADRRARNGEGTYGARLGRIVEALRASREPDAGLIVLGSGALPLARQADYRRLVDAAASGSGAVLTNNRYSGDVVAISRAADLGPVPDLPGDNALPRWLEEHAGRPVADLSRVWRLQVDLDGPLDLVLIERSRRAAGHLPAIPEELASAVRDRLAAVAAAMGDRRAEVLVAGRSSAATLRWLERSIAARTRFFIEERGLRASSPLALGSDEGRRRAFRPPRSILGLLLDRDGPATLGAHLATLADAALVDTRVLLAHRLGPDEHAWPSAEDRFASDLLLPEPVDDPWLKALTMSALAAPIPVLLGGHSLVGPGVRLVAAASHSKDS